MYILISSSKGGKEMKIVTMQEIKISRALACLRMSKTAQEAYHLGANDNIDFSQWKSAEKRYRDEI